MEQTAPLLSLGILLASFLGSWHCAGMCGPIASYIGSQGSLMSYHLGRWASYTSLGVLGGALGSFIQTESFVEIRYVVALVFSLVLFAMGLKQLSLAFSNILDRHLPWQVVLQKVIRRTQAFSLNKGPFIVGVLTAFLPCAWLYSYVLAAIASQSPWAGGLIMTLFWLGGLPALIAIPRLVKSTLGRSSGQQQKIAGALLIAASLYSLLSFFVFESH